MMIKNKIRMGDIISESYYKKDNNGLVIIFCMGIPSKSNFEELAKKYVDEGFVFIHPKYIGSWESYGDFSIKSCKETISSIVQGIRNKNLLSVFGEKIDLNVKKIFLLGHSFGGSVALTTGADLDIDGIIAQSPITDYRLHAKQKEYAEEDLLQLYDFLRLGFENVYRNLKKGDWDNFCENGDEINPADYIDKLKAKDVLILHGKKDKSVSYKKSRLFFGKIKGNSRFSKYIETEDDHSTIKEGSIQEIISWIRGFENEPIQYS